MSDSIKHECGIAFIRLLKPLDYYQQKYGSPLYGLKKLQLLMAKQINRGQDGAGIGVIKLDPQFGNRYIARKRSNSTNPVNDIFDGVNASLKELDKTKINNSYYLKESYPYAGELMLGHLRYGTHGGNSIENLHPFLRQNNWMCRNLVIAGNYNLTNVDELFEQLIELGQQPKQISDNVTMLEKIGHFLDEENERIFRKYKKEGLSNYDITEKIKEDLSVENILKNAFKRVDGGFAMVGMIGHGAAFVIRDPNGIRPAYYYQDEDILVVASERPAIATTFNAPYAQIKEITPGSALIINKDGSIAEKEIMKRREQKSCSFERIYFSRGNDSEIYAERKALGRILAPTVLEKIGYDLENTVFSYIPNTAATSFYGMLDGVNEWLKTNRAERIMAEKDSLTPEKISLILNNRIRREKILVKDAKMRTFITNDKDREDIVGHAYDVTYGIIRPGIDSLVIIDDSIVRGTTLKSSILRILGRLQPKKIFVVSSAPQIRYPDCYGIDMSRLKDFVAFRALLMLLKENNLEHKLNETYELCKLEMQKPAEEMVNKVNDLYNLFTPEQISDMVAKIVTPENFKPEVHIIFQTVENLNKSCPKNTGDWYFTGNFPTPGGTKVANRAFIFFMEGNKARAY
ncbi:MAG: amidophosphoribosyltransferase [Bacteroidia bacterium]|nr:amidophosphoribosyltransferase [Bacteroidia bacterium]